VWKWVCDCGWTADEDGSLHAMGLAGFHLRDTKAAGEQHKILGLYDEHDRLVIKGLALAQARRLFQGEAVKGTAERSEEEGEEEARRPKGKGTKAQEEVAWPDAAGRSRKADILASRISLSDIVLLLFQSDVRAHPECFPENVLTDDRVFSDQLAAWIETMVIQVHIDHAEELGFSWFFDRIARQAAATMQGVS
jgi:hypothetical protein